jgi:type IV secretion system protein VirD4
VAELIRSAIGRLSWRVDNVNTSLYEFNAVYQKQERVKGINWHYTFRSTITWEPADTGVHIKVEVREDDNNWTEDNCRQYCDEILKTLSERAAALTAIEKNQTRPTTYGSAHWAELADLEAAGYISEMADPRRLLVGRVDGHKVSLPPADTIKHALVCGPTGSGKTSSIFVPNLLERLQTSAIVTEATAGSEPPDLYTKTAGWRQQQGGQHIYYFNPDDLRSNQINPLDQVESIDTAQHLAGLIIRNTTKKNAGGDPIWETSETHLLTALILHAVGEKGNLAMVRRLMQGGPEGLNKIFAGSQIKEAQDEYAAFYKNSTEGFRNGVTSGLMQRLNLWINPRIAKLTERTDIDLKALPNQLFSFYMAVPAQKTQLKPLSALIFNFVLDLALQQRFEHPLALVLDEFTNFGFIPAIAEKLTIIRHSGIPAMLGIQDYVQLQNVYGIDTAKLLFSQPATKIFFRPRELDTAKKISDSLGTQTVVDRKVSSSGNINEREFGKPLMAAGEVMALKENNAIVFTAATAPVQIERFNWQEFEPAMTVTPPARRKLDVDEALTRVCRQAEQPPPGWRTQYENERERRQRSRQKDERDIKHKSDSAPAQRREEAPEPEPEPPEIDDTSLDDDDYDDEPAP